MSAATVRGRVRLPGGEAWRTDALWCLATMAAAVLTAMLVLNIWDANLHVPMFGTTGDNALNMVIVKDAIEPGWFQFNDQLGAPFGQNLLDFPVVSGDNLQYTFVKSFALVSDDVAAVTNAFFLLTFALTAGTAFLVMRALGLSRPAAFAGSLLFALVPYHFLRHQMHLMLSSYASVPLGCFLVLSVLLQRPRWRLREGVSGRRAWFSATTVATLVCVVVVASASVYYATFTVVLLVAVTILTGLSTRRRRTFVEGGALVVAIVAVMAVNLAPNVVYRAVEGTNAAVAQRAPVESEIYSLNLAQLVMPSAAHRIGPLADLGAKYGSTTLIQSEGSATLGTVGTVGLVVGLIIVLVSALGGWAPTGRWLLARAAGMAALLALLVATTGGLSSVISYLLTSQVRGWGRISIFIAFFALVVAAVLLDAARTRLAARPRGALLAGGAVAVLAVLGALDQTSPRSVPAYASHEADWANDARFVKAIEDRLPGDAEIYQLPYVPFPENPPVGEMIDYDHARGYLHSDRLRFSYGAMKGRASDWSVGLTEADATTLLASVAAAGFEGLWIDRGGYADHGKALETQVQRLTGQQPMQSENGRVVFYDLRPYAEAQRARAGEPAVAALKDATLHPVTWTWADGFYDGEGGPGGHWRWMGPTGTLVLDNPDDGPREVAVIARLESGHPGTATIRWPDGSEQKVQTGARPVTLQRTVRLAPGANSVVLTTNSRPAPRAKGDDRDLRLSVAGLTVTTPAATAALAPR